MNEYFYGDKRIIEKYYGDMVLYRYEAGEGGDGETGGSGNDVYQVMVGEILINGYSYVGYLGDLNTGSITPNYYEKEESRIQYLYVVKYGTNCMISFIVENYDFAVYGANTPIKIHIGGIETDVMRHGNISGNTIEVLCSESVYSYIESKIGSVISVEFEKPKEYNNKTVMKVGKCEADREILYGFSDGELKVFEPAPFGSISNSHFLHESINIHSCIFSLYGYAGYLYMVTNCSLYNILTSNGGNAIALRIGGLNIDFVLSNLQEDGGSNANLNYFVTALYISPDFEKLEGLLVDKEAKGEDLDIEFLGFSYVDLG